VQVEGRGSRTFEVEGKLTASPTEVAALGANCVANKMKTKYVTHIIKRYI
jgi:hypothetical protein